MTSPIMGNGEAYALTPSAACLGEHATLMRRNRSGTLSAEKHGPVRENCLGSEKKSAEFCHVCGRDFMTLFAKWGGFVGKRGTDVLLEPMINGVLHFAIRPFPSSTTDEDLHGRRTDAVRQVGVVGFEARRLVHEKHDLRVGRTMYTSCMHMFARHIMRTLCPRASMGNKPVLRDANACAHGSNACSVSEDMVDARRVWCVHAEGL